MSGRFVVVPGQGRVRYALVLIAAAAVLLLLSLSSDPDGDSTATAGPARSPGPMSSAPAMPSIAKESDVKSPGPQEKPEVSATSSDETEPSGDSGDVTPSETPLDPDQVRAAARSAVERYLALYDAGLQGTEIDSDELESVSTGSALTELEAAAADYAEQHFRQRGDAQILGVSFPSMALESDQPRVVADVCVDARDIDVLDQGGNSLAEFLFRPGEPILQTYDIALHHSAWRVVSRQISDEVVPCTG